MRHGACGSRVLAAALLTAAVFGCDQSVADDTDGGNDGGSVVVTVLFGGVGHEVVLGTLPTTLVEGASVVGLQAVVQAALPGEAPEAFVAGFASSDGFRPEDRDFCLTLVPVDWATLGRGYVDPTTRDLLWDAALGFPGCMSPRDVAQIDVTRP